jgi:hypothetical protein
MGMDPIGFFNPFWLGILGGNQGEHKRSRLVMGATTSVQAT